MTLRNNLLTLCTLLFLYSCSSTTTIVDTSEPSTSIFPSWYSTSSFTSDSTSHYGFGIAIAADSSVAVQRAVDDATKNLDLAIGKLTEDVRTQLVSEGVRSAGNTDFILILRNAHANALKLVTVGEQFERKENNSYRAFAQVGLSKSELINQLEVGFNGHPRYWAAFSDNPIFKATFE